MVTESKTEVCMKHDVLSPVIFVHGETHNTQLCNQSVSQPASQFVINEIRAIPYVMSWGAVAGQKL